jgi:hypothetical protein
MKPKKGGRQGKCSARRSTAIDLKFFFIPPPIRARHRRTLDACDVWFEIGEWGSKGRVHWLFAVDRCDSALALALETESLFTTLS